MINRLGVMQGRLLPKYRGRYQAHPVGYWSKEFEIARSFGLSFIEFILDYENINQNPLMHDAGLDEIRNCSDQSGIAVKTICADYLMEAPLHHTNKEVVAQSIRLLSRLLKNANILGVTDIVIPCVDQARFADEWMMTTFIQNSRPVRDMAEKLNIRLALETDLSPELFRGFLEELDSPVFTVNYDTGNSAAMGYDPVLELAAYGERISDIHLKDRARGGPSVELGRGDTDFQSFFNALTSLHYTGPLIMQAYRDEEGVAIFKTQLDWLVENFIK